MIFIYLRANSVNETLFEKKYPKSRFMINIKYPPVKSRFIIIDKTSIIVVIKINILSLEITTLLKSLLIIQYNTIIIVII